ncbi:MULTISPECIES: low temperature requirement protein A [unclassified Rathayibacter]|uniref:low temperature requirement protein A n=1 Tax=unclassified Rathayibacter TaxID=2609250 RepID=UPI000F4B1604|nr:MULTISPECIES: low temperature requirement protein A [unclassified Rathayibacter]ROP56671.1 low temperature requirement protein LtrA [Rathayibacter sp. PhB186]ROS55056.1 low temperature requirement protein LtrA [Rathayibacter sp. PhB185]
MTLLRVRMRPRAVDEPHRVSSPLELLVDLTFVVAIAQIAAQLAHATEEGHLGETVLPFAMVFFAIWWAWMNFTWFASGYDTDDVPYRLLTLAQMGGVLVLAAGVPTAFEEGDFTAITVGYAIMRFALVSQWLRVAVSTPEQRVSALRSAGGFSLVQVGWLLRLLLPDELLLPERGGVVSFVVLAALELAVPLWALRAGESSWHPHHIAERYGLFTIILLGEGVLAAVTGVQQAVTESGVSLSLVIVAACALVIVFALWWLSFLHPSGELLARRRDLSFRWGYAHFVIFAALGGLGAGLESAVAATAGHLEASDTVIGAAVAVPVAAFLVMLWAVHLPLAEGRPLRASLVLPAALAVLATPLLAAPLGVAAVLTAIALLCAALVATALTPARV